MTFWRLISICIFFLLATTLTADETSITDSAGHRLLYLPGGRFVQGSSGGERALTLDFPLSTTGQFFGNAEKPAHVTWLTQPFYLAETEVTVGQFKAFVAATGYKTTAEQNKTEMVGWAPSDAKLPLYQSFDFQRAEAFSWKNPGFEQTDKHPVVGVSWADTQAYCAWLSKKEGQPYRLPTEAEWEYACRAGSKTWFSFGDVARGVVHRYGNLGNVELEKHRKHAAERQWLLDWEHDTEDGHVFTAPVGSYQANAWGFHDMHGNAWEWCQDLWLDTAYKEFIRPKYNEPTGVSINPLNTNQPQTPSNDFHTIRGGSWYNGDLICRSSNRTYWDREDAACYIGFRIARDAPTGKDRSAATALSEEQAALRQIKAAGGRIYSSNGLDIEVRFDGESFNEQALKALAFLPDLQRLQLHQSKSELTNAHLVTIGRLSQLQLIEFGSSLDPDAVDLTLLAQLKQLKVLQFSRTGSLNDSHLKQLTQLSSLKEFRCFGVNGGLTDIGISYLKGNRDLEILEVWENDATGKFLSVFVGCPLITLSASSRDQSEGKLIDDELKLLSQFPNLNSLNLSNQTLLSGSTFSVISDLSNLRRLTLNGCHGVPSTAFAELNRLQRLQYLQINNTQAGDIAAAAIANIPRIIKLKMSCDGLTDRGLKSLSGAFSLQNLELASVAITDEGLRELGRINRLDNLVIRSPKITGTGLASIAALPSLRDLSLITPSLTDVTFEYLATAKSLQKLRLAHSGYRPSAALTDAGMMKLAKAKWLKEIWLPRNDTGMTEAKMSLLNKLMPTTNVIPYTVQWKE